MATVSARPLLVELFVEELPSKALNALGVAFAKELAGGLAQRHFIAGPPVHHPFATPRRLAVVIENVQSESMPRQIPAEAFMPASVAFDASGAPTAALVKKIKRRYHDEVDVDALIREKFEIAEQGGKRVLMHRAELASPSRLSVGLEGALQDALARLPIPKVMQYQLADGWTSVSFVRPAHGLVALHGDEVVPVHALGLEAGRTTHGHRFEGSRAPIVLRNALSYEAQLRDEGAVIASFAKRRAEIERQLQSAAAAAGLAPIDDDALLDEVTALVERPNVLRCEFDREFLAVPPECLVLTMKANQKYFPLMDAAGRLTNRFLVVSNIAPADPARIVEGNERVVRPRLADAKFFYDQDRKRTLESRLPGLDKVVYHGKLGSQGDRVRRLCAIAGWVAERIGADAALAKRAALLAKADLLTDMVGEFPELQGIMGGYYAAHDGEPADVVAAIRDQYDNRRGGVESGPNRVGAALLLADRAETLVGIWGIGQKPTGDKDPYALRRHALTVIHQFSILEGAAAFVRVFGRAPPEDSKPNRETLSLRALLAFTATTFAVPLDPATVDDVEGFIYERLANQLAQTNDVRMVGAVMALRPPLQDVEKRLAAVREFLTLGEAADLAAANKRVSNILKKSDEAAAAAPEPTLLTEGAEIALHDALVDVGRRSKAHFEAGRYAESLRSLAALRDPVDAFFDTVMVNVESPALRANRLALLASLRTAMNRVADLSRLAS